MNDKSTVTTSISGSQSPFNIESEILRRYGNGANRTEAGLCCPTEYEKKYIDLLPAEIVGKDYGCGDPSLHIEEGETVLDLGSGAGKICYILSQKVGAKGKVIGVDFNPDMLSLARKYIPEMTAKLGYGNVSFVKGKIQDLALDLEFAQEWLDKNPVKSVEDSFAFDAECERLRNEQPLIETNRIDTVVSNCVLNLVQTEDKKKLFAEIYRVLKMKGKAVISDIVCDEDPTPGITSNPELWSGCIAGAFREDRFLEMFEDAGFYGIEVLSRQGKPWQIIDGIEFRSVTVRAFKGKEGECLDKKQALIYKGPWRCVTDDDGHTYFRGKRMAVCGKTYSIMI